MGISFTNEQMEALVAKAIIDGLTPEQRTEMITTAIKQVLAKPVNQNSWGDKRSELQLAFDRAVTTVANNIATDMIKNDEAFKAQIKSLFVDVSEKLFSSERRDEMASNIAGVIEKALTRDRY